MQHTQVIENYRVTLWGSSIRFVDLTNAGKRGKFCTEHIFKFDFPISGNNLGIEKTKALYLELKGKTIEEIISNLINNSSYSTVGYNITYHKGVDVSPDLPTIEINTSKWNLYCRIDYRGSFDLTITDKTDSYNDPTIIFSHRNTKTEKAKVYKLISENQEHIKTLDRMGDVYDYIHNNTKVYLHSYCAVD
jgi:hypothetical protein